MLAFWRPARHKTRWMCGPSARSNRAWLRLVLASAGDVMFGSIALEIAIGLVFTYVLFSLVVSTISEMISNILRLRARNLRLAIARLLDTQEGNVIQRGRAALTRCFSGIVAWITGNEPSMGTDMVASFYQQPRVAALRRSGQLPSYIPEEIFSEVLVELLDEGGTRARRAVERLAQEVGQSATLAGAQSHVQNFVDAVDERTKFLKLLRSDSYAADPVTELANFLNALATNNSFLQAGRTRLSELAAANTKKSELLAAETRKQLACCFKDIPTMSREDRDELNTLATTGSVPATTTPRQLSGMLGSVAVRLPSFDVRELVGNLPEGPLKQTLTQLAQEAAGQLQEFRNKVENWFNDTMERAVGWYKVRTRKITFVIAVVVVVSVNVDSIRLTQDLASDSALRAAIVSQSELLAQQEKRIPQPVPKFDATRDGILLASNPIQGGYRGHCQHCPGSTRG